MKYFQDLKKFLILLCFWFLSFICSTFSFNLLKILFKWSLPLTSGRFHWLLEGINIYFATPIPVLVENTFITFNYSSFSRGYHVCKDAWILIFRDDSPTCEREHNENNKNVVAILWDDCVSKKILEHVLLNWSKVASKSLQFTNHHIRVEVTGRKVNRGDGLGHEISASYFFMKMQEL